jgi:cell division protein FtsB
MEYKEKIKLRRYLYSRVTLSVLLIILVILIKAVFGIYQKEKLTRDNLDKAEAEYLELEDRDAFLQKEIDSLNTQGGMEKAVRERFGVAKEGEKVIILLDEKKVPDTKVKEGKGFWNWFKGLFK